MTEWRRLTGRIRVALAPEQAFRLFTPMGEQDWAPGWHPHFPAPVTDDSRPGTVFETRAHDQHTIWVVTGRSPGESISYARVTPGDSAGTVTVTISGAVTDDSLSEVEVTYQLTALTDAGAQHLRQFAEGYDAYLRSWQDAIATLITRTPT
jgi:hypothetical protein